MDFPKDQIDELKSLFGNITGSEEAGITYLLIPKLKLPGSCVPNEVDALLCPSGRDGYPSRLYFAQQIQSSKSLNWNGNIRILERNWFAFSWKIDPNLRLAQMIAAFLRVLK
jgi:hypothetical protein